jgi:hypothetical protein
MATTTTNFGWDIPQSTDLVKDGATAIATLGQDIDTALVDLKGGTTGQVLSKATGTDLDFTWSAPSTASFVGASAFHAATQSIANDTFTAVNFTSESFDSNAFHDNSTNNTRFTIPAGKGGKYLVNALVRYATNSSGRRIASLRKNGSTYIANTQDMGASSISGLEPTVLMTSINELVAGDYVEFMVYQNSGGALNISGGQDLSTCTIQFLGA